MVYKLLSIPRRLLSIVIVVMVIASVGAGSVVLSSPHGAALFSVVKPGHTFALRPEDMYRAARLTAAERQLAVDDCTARASSWISLTKSFARAEARQAATERACDCFVNQMEDRSSKLQFAVAMEAIANAPWTGGRGVSSATAKYRKIARNSGMSDVEYERAMVETRTVMDVAARTCIAHLRGR
ncbi:MAG TPA: hypothetical protein PK970_11630 [Hyphomicrobiaceae bacterium]|nr:hypothetical protein [Hyphomicrobiaceae bacterium]